MSDETEVLRETVKRISTLSEEIQTDTTEIVRVSCAALDRLRQLAQSRPAGSGAAAHRKAIAFLKEVQAITNKARQADPILKGGIEAAGPAAYAGAWADVEATLEELNVPEYQRFYGTMAHLQNLLAVAEDSLDKAIRSDALRVFGDDDEEQQQEADARDVASLGELLGLARARNRTEQANAAVVNQLRRAATAAASSHSVETTAALKKFRAYGQQHTARQHALLLRLFLAEQAQEYSGLVSEVFKVEEAQLAKKVARLSKSKPQGAMSVLDELEVSLEYDPDGDDTRNLTDAAGAYLRDCYTTTHGAIKAQKIESEVSIAGATDRVALVIRDISKRSIPVGKTLELMPLRSYLPSPAPEWLKDFPLTKSMPGLVDLYCADFAEDLLYYIALQNKKLGRSLWQQGVNLMFNTSFLSHFIEKNNLSAPGSLLMDRIKRYHKQGMKMYMTEWQHLSIHLMDPTQSKPGGKLSSKDREAIKERFRLFNSEFDYLVDRHRRASIPDKQLRQEFITAISQTIRPLYQRFYDLHSGGDFTKNVDKYIKYDMKKLDEVIATL